MKKKLTPLYLALFLCAGTYTPTCPNVLNPIYSITSMVLVLADSGLSHSSKRIVAAACIEDPLARIIATKKLYRFALTCTPLIGKHFRCTNKKCEGICNRCKLKFIYAELPIQILMMHENPGFIDDTIHIAELCCAYLWFGSAFFKKIAHAIKVKSTDAPLQQSQ